MRFFDKTLKFKGENACLVLNLELISFRVILKIISHWIVDQNVQYDIVSSENAGADDDPPLRLSLVMIRRVGQNTDELRVNAVDEELYFQYVTAFK